MNKKLKKKRRFALLLVVIISGCSRAGPTDKQESIIIFDDLGRRLVLTNEVDRIVTNYGIASHMLFLLRAQHKLVAMDSPSRKDKLYNALLPGVDKMDTVGMPYDFDAEKAISLRADLVLLPGRNLKMLSNIGRFGLNTYAIIVENIEEIRSSILNLGRALNREVEAISFVRYYDTVIKITTERTINIKDKRRPLVYLVGPMGVMSTCSEDMFQNHLINLCGGRNAGAMVDGKMGRHGWIEISAEQLIKWDPEVILVVQYSGTSPEMIMADSRWQVIKAVRDKRVYWFPSRLKPWDYPSPQAALGVKWLAKTLHPDLFPDVDMIKEANRFYSNFYGMSFTELGGRL